MQSSHLSCVTRRHWTPTFTAMALNYHILCITNFLLLVLFEVGGSANLSYDCQQMKNRLSPKNNQAKCGDCIEGYSEDIYDEDRIQKCIPNSEPIHYECRCNEQLLSCPKYLESDEASSMAFICVVEGVYPMPNISFQVKNELLLVPATLNVNTTCEHSPDGPGSLTVRCQLSSKDLQEIQKEITNVDLTFYVEYSSGNHSEFISHWTSEQTGTSTFSKYTYESAVLKWVAVALFFIMGLLLSVLLKFCIVYCQETRKKSAAVNKSELLIRVESSQQKFIHPLKNKLHEYIMRL